MQTNPFHHSKHLAERELGPSQAGCPLCGDSGPRAGGPVLQESPRVELLRCGVCGGASVSRMPTTKALQAYYGAYYDGQEQTHTFHDADRLARHILREVLRWRSPEQGVYRILDFGGGDGSVSMALAERLARVCGSDIMLVCVDYQPPKSVPLDRVSVIHATTLDDCSEGFDLVIASAILEHVALPGETLQQLIGKLAPGGVFYARTPWVLPLKQRIASLDFGFPAHLHDMGGAFWDRIAGALDLPVIARQSRPSIVETTFQRAPLRTLAAHALKAPAHLQNRVQSLSRLLPRWPYVGGWEVVWTRSCGAPKSVEGEQTES